MARLLPLLLGLVGILFSCKSAEVDPNSEVRYLDTSEFAASRTRTFQVPGRPNEICVIPKKFPGGDYDKDDRDDEQDLCAMDFRSSKYAICPKLGSTNPALEVYDMPSGMSKSAFESSECPKRDRSGSKLAKYKMSVTCSYTGSILAYYHMSRLLGMGHIPPAVIRTFDLEDHKKFAKKGVQYSAGKGYIHKTWTELETLLGKADKFILTNDKKQTFGALSVNPTGERRHPLFNVKPYSSFVAKPWVKKVMNQASVRETLTNAFFASQGIKVDETENGQFTRATYGLGVMRDISDMILIDYIMGQQDRLGNIHAKDYYYYKTSSGKVKRKKASKVANPSTLGQVYSTVSVPRLLLKDNDCGVRRESNLFRNNKALQNVRHMAPKTYKRFMWVANNWSSIRSFLKTESTMATSNIFGENLKHVGDNISEARSILYNNCKSGKLLLDLDVEDHLEKKNTRAAVSGLCDEVYVPSNTKDEGGASTPRVEIPAENTSNGSACTVDTPVLNVRNSPSTAGTSVLNTLNQGHPVTILSTEGGWSSVRFTLNGKSFGGTSGSSARWVYSSLLRCN